jgi:hypothetical protein
MATPEDLYVNGIKKRFRHYFATWLPDEKLMLGDVGILDGNIFVRTTNIKDPSIGFEFSIREDPHPAPLDVTSESGVSIVIKAAGEVSKALPNVPKAEAGLSIEFSSQGAFILKSPGVQLPSIENIEELKQDVLRAYRDGRWDKHWAVVVRLVTASTATIIVSRSSQSKLELSAGGSYAVGDIDLGNANLKLGMRSQSGDLFQMIGAANATPMFQLARIKKPFFGAPQVQLFNKSQRQLLPIDLVTPESAKNDTLLDFDLITDNDDEFVRNS